MRPISHAIIAALLLLAAAAPALDLDITTPLLDASPGSWIRNRHPDDHYNTIYVADNTEDTVNIQLIRTSDNHTLSNKLYIIPKEYIKTHGLDPASQHATPTTIDIDGKPRHVIRLTTTADGRDIDYYFDPAQPATGIIRKDIHPDTGPERITETFPHHGPHPDPLILNAGPPDETITL